MPKYKVQSNIKNNGRTYEAGETIELDESIADSLLKDGIIAELDSEKTDGGQDEKDTGANESQGNTGSVNDEGDQEKADEKEEKEEAENTNGQDSPKEFSEMATGELIAIMKAKEIVYEGNDRAEMIALLERSERVSNADDSEGGKDNAENGNDL